MSSTSAAKCSYWFDYVYIDDDWSRATRVLVAEDGTISDIEQGTEPQQQDVRINGFALPGMANAHSHAFQRLLRGFTEYRLSRVDSFWTWRERMYAFAELMTPEILEVVSSQLYVEMLKQGYTAVAEFHYLHHRPGGEHHQAVSEMAQRLLQAADQSGIGLTLLPVLYQQSDFAGNALHKRQLPFAFEREDFAAYYAHLLEHFDGLSANKQWRQLGCAIHSLRAVDRDNRLWLLNLLDQLDPSAPIHIHIAEQLKEVEDCIDVFNASPVQLLMQEHEIDHRWNLVHATHISPEEIAQIANSGATVVLCPTTEANLGDGIFPITSFLEEGGSIALGSDSQVVVDPFAELQCLEYGQRLMSRSRNVCSSDEEPHVAQFLWQQMMRGGRKSLGEYDNRIVIGARADIIVLDPNSIDFVGGPTHYLLDRAVFGQTANNVAQVIVGGEWLVRDFVHVNEEEIEQRFRQTASSLYHTMSM